MKLCIHLKNNCLFLKLKNQVDTEYDPAKYLLIKLIYAGVESS